MNRHLLGVSANNFSLNDLRKLGFGMSLAQYENMAQKPQNRSKHMAQIRALARLPRTSRPVIELQHSLPSQIAAIAPSVELVMRFISKFRKADGSEANI